MFSVGILSIKRKIRRDQPDEPRQSTCWPPMQYCIEVGWLDDYQYHGPSPNQCDTVTLCLHWSVILPLWFHIF